jgi:hypothetical protein
MKTCLLSLILILPLVTAVNANDEDPSWSRPDNGLRGRLTVVLPTKGNEPFFRVFIEFQNVARVLGQKRIDFSPEKMTFKITSKDGALRKPATEAYDGMIVSWEPILLPFDGTIKFPIECQGLAISPATKAVIDLDSPRVWIIPQDGNTYFLSGTLLIPEDASDHSTMIWHGTLDFPPAEIPKAN